MLHIRALLIPIVFITVCIETGPRVDQLATCITIPSLIVDVLHGIETYTQTVSHKKICQPLPTAERPLLHAYPALALSVPHTQLADLPTLVQHLVNLGNVVDIQQLYVKRDDLTGKVFGGNKVRKLEFLLADAYQQGADTVLTFGCVGSNHVVATAVYAEYLGLNCIAMLKPQPNSRVVRRNLMLMHLHGADIQFCTTNQLRAIGTAYICARYALNTGSFPYCIPTGGSNPRGALGYVNAAFELKEQIKQGLLPEPDYIYVATGGVASSGTIAGLTLGCCAAGLKTTIVGIATEPESEIGAHFAKVVRLFNQTNSFIGDFDPSFGLYTFPSDRVRVMTDFCGKSYGEFTQEGVYAADLMQRYAGIRLDGTYTGKACAGMLYDVQARGLQDKVILFWNTFSAVELNEAEVDYTELPFALQDYFQTDVQELDRK